MSKRMKSSLPETELSLIDIIRHHERESRQPLQKLDCKPLQYPPHPRQTLPTSQQPTRPEGSALQRSESAIKAVQRDYCTPRLHRDMQRRTARMPNLHIASLPALP